VERIFWVISAAFSGIEIGMSAILSPININSTEMGLFVRWIIMSSTLVFVFAVILRTIFSEMNTTNLARIKKARKTTIGRT
jgi:hypothetical protein